MIDKRSIRIIICESSRKSSTGDDSVYLMVERKNSNDHTNKPASISNGPYNLNNVKNNTVLIEKTEWYVFKAS